MKALLIKSLILLCVTNAVGRSVWSSEVVKHIIRGVMKQYLADCVYFVQSAHSQGIVEAQYMTELRKSYGGELMQMASAYIGDVNVTELRCRPLCVVLSCCHDGLPESLRKVSTDMKWLVFIDTTASLDHVFRDLDIPFDCEFLVAQQSGKVSLTEVYRVHHLQPLQKYRVANWSSAGGFAWTTTSFNTRRGDLQGVTITGAAFRQVPYLYCGDTCAEEHSGFVVRLLKHFESLMNFTFEYQDTYKGSYGARYENGSWDGVIGMIVNNEAEVGLNVLDFEIVRLEAVDYFPALWNLKKMLFIKEPGMGSSSERLLLPFAAPTWTATLAAVLLFIIFLTATSHLASRQQNDDVYSLYNSAFCMIAVLCRQSHHRTPRRFSWRMVYLTACLTITILFVAYSDSFITHLTVRRYDLPFLDFKGLLEDGRYEVGVTSGSFRSSYFKASSDQVLRRIYHKFIYPGRETAPNTASDGLTEICTRKRYAFLTSVTIYQLIRRQLPCVVVGIPHAYYSKAVSLVMRKGSRYKRLFVHHMLRLRQTGIMKRIMDETWQQHSREILLEPPPSVTLEMVIIIHLLFVLGILLSLVILCMEYLIWRGGWYKQKRAW